MQQKSTDLSEMMHKVARMMSKSIRRLKKRPRRKTQQPRYVMIHHQAGQIRIYAATQNYSDSKRAQVIGCRLQYYRPYLERIARAVS